MLHRGLSLVPYGMYFCRLCPSFTTGGQRPAFASSPFSGETIKHSKELCGQQRGEVLS